MDHNKQRGITLIELVVVMSIVAILAVIGYQSYYNYMLTARRSDAINGFQQNKLLLENYFAHNGTFPNDGSEINLLTQSPNGNYQLSYTFLGGESYTLTASAISASQIQDIDCGTMYMSREMAEVYPLQCN